MPVKGLATNHYHKETTGTAWLMITVLFAVSAWAVLVLMARIGY